MCALWDIRYHDWKEDSLEVWCVDENGVPLYFLRRISVNDHPEFRELQPTWAEKLFRVVGPYRCVACGEVFNHWEEVRDHLPPMDFLEDFFISPPPDETPWKYNP